MNESTSGRKQISAKKEFEREIVNLVIQTVLLLPPDERTKGLVEIRDLLGGLLDFSLGGILASRAHLKVGLLTENGCVLFDSDRGWSRMDESDFVELFSRRSGDNFEDDGISLEDAIRFFSQGD